MVRLRDPCERQSLSQQERPWWEPPYVVYGFSQRRVRSRLEQLMGSYVVRATDRQYMLELQQRIREDHERKTRARIQQSEQGEVEREKLLILEGRSTMTEAPKELRNHPVMRITRRAQEELKGRRTRDRARGSGKVIKRFDYSLLAGREEEAVQDLEMTSCVDLPDQPQEEYDMGEYLERIQEEVSEEDYARIKYKDPLVEELEEVEGAEDVYEVAAEIVGVVKTACGGLLRRKGGGKTTAKI